MSGNNPYGQDSQHHVLSVLVQNRPGVLARVSALFARRGYNIFSLAVAPTEHHDYSRITIVVDLDSAPLEQMTKQLFKLVDVVRISELDPKHSVERELVMATVKATREQRGQVVELTNIFEGKILAVGVDALTVSLDGSPSKVDDFMALLRLNRVATGRKLPNYLAKKVIRVGAEGITVFGVPLIPTMAT